MIRFSKDEKQMLKHITDVIGDRMRNEPGEYTATDAAVIEELDRLADSKGTSFLVIVDGSEIDESDRRKAMKDIVNAELDNWVPMASQRLLHRAGHALGIEQPDPAHVTSDCGPDIARHATYTEWVAGMYLDRCAVCLRLFR